ncbi:hypothetical protein DFH11DRAFT_1549884 [Phellopilus nigrolimitatus]|nr:hypothetical protein DFH11DRAFT_1549884 [Phellopilus nigrolimitatus]
MKLCATVDFQIGYFFSGFRSYLLTKHFFARLAMLTLLVYNTVITMEKEIKYFWNCYIGSFGAISIIVSNETLCKHPDTTFHSLLIILKGHNFIWIQVLTNILLMCVLALYHQDNRLAAFLRTLFGLGAAFSLTMVIYDTIYEEIIVEELAEGVTFCGANRATPKVWSSLIWAPPILYELILMVLALYKAAEHWRETAGFIQFTLVKVLIQDQAIYFIIVMHIVSDQLSITNVLLAHLLNVLGSPSLLCVLGSHLLVHLKEAGERGANGGTSYRMKTMSGIEFS